MREEGGGKDSEKCVSAKSRFGKKFIKNKAFEFGAYGPWWGMGYSWLELVDTGRGVCVSVSSQGGGRTLGAFMASLASFYTYVLLSET